MELDIEGKKFFDYITEYQKNAENDIIRKISEGIGVDEDKLRNFLHSDVDETNINEFGRFDDLVKTVNIEKAQEYFEKIENREIPVYEVNIKVNKLLRKIVIDGHLE